MDIEGLKAIEIRRHRRIWGPWMIKNGIKSICEIGVFESQNFRRILEGNPVIAVGIDLWREDGNPARNDSGFEQDRLDQQCELFKSLMTNPAVRLYRDYSFDAVQNFPDEYFDLIYIDADHSYDGVKRDLEDWWPKVKKGGYFTGDDYSHSYAPVTGVKFGVIEAVNEFCKKNNLTVHELPSHGWAIFK
jgi:hypothetical protein